jgi:hypothetical protein
MTALALLERQGVCEAAAVPAACSAAGERSEIETEGDMSWIKPTFDEIKMDAEAKSYSDGLTW